MKKMGKNLIIAIIAFLAIASIFALYQTPLTQPEEMSLTQLSQEINGEAVEEIRVEGDELKIKKKDDDKEYKAKKETEASLTESLKNYNLKPEKLEKTELDIL